MPKLKKHPEIEYNERSVESLCHSTLKKVVTPHLSSMDKSKIKKSNNIVRKKNILSNLYLTLLMLSVFGGLSLAFTMLIKSAKEEEISNGKLIGSAVPGFAIMAASFIGVGHIRRNYNNNDFRYNIYSEYAQAHEILDDIKQLGSEVHSMHEHEKRAQVLRDKLSNSKNYLK